MTIEISVGDCLTLAELISDSQYNSTTRNDELPVVVKLKKEYYVVTSSKIKKGKSPEKDEFMVLEVKPFVGF
jgi:hypothetical protein